jgi:hypothetical protein
MAGSYPITVEAYNGADDTTAISATLVVDPAAAATITPSISSTGLRVGDSATLSAVIEDAYGNVVTDSWSATSSVAGDISGTTFAPSSAGARTLAFSSGAASATLQVTVSPAATVDDPDTTLPGVSTGALGATGVGDGAVTTVALAVGLLMVGGLLLLLRRRRLG